MVIAGVTPDSRAVKKKRSVNNQLFKIIKGLTKLKAPSYDHKKDVNTTLYVEFWKLD